MTEVEIREASRQLIYLVSCALRDEAPDTERIAGINLNCVFDVARKHLLTSAAGMALEKGGVRDPRFQKAVADAQRRTLLMDRDRAAVQQKLEEAGIWYLPLKGAVLKDFYPRFGMREMADNDILVDPQRMTDVRSLMEGLGFSVKEFGFHAHDVYCKPPVSNFEMHKMLFFEPDVKQLAAYYKDVSQRLLKDPDHPCARYFSPDDFYLYLAAHEYKHYTANGTGLRSLADIYVCLHRQMPDLEWIAREAAKMGFADFERENRELALALFDGAPLTPKQETMLEGILADGIYGSIAAGVERTIAAEGKGRYLLHRIFPPMGIMKDRFPAMRKAPVLYPVFWVYRLFRGIFVSKKRKKAGIELKKLFRPEAVSSLARWCRPVRGSLWILCLLGVLATLLALAIPLITRELVDSAVGGEKALLWKYGAFLLGVTALKRVVSFLSARLTVKTSAALQKTMQRTVTEQILSRDYAALKGYHSGELVNRVFSDVTVIRKGVTEVLPSLIQIAVSFVGAAVILAGMDWRFLPVMLVCSVLWAGMTFLFRKPMKRRHRDMQQAEDALHAATQETLENIRLVKAGGTERRSMAQVEARAGALQGAQVRNGNLSAWMKGGIGSVMDASWLLCYLWGCVKIFRGEFTYGSLAALIPLVGRIQGPVVNASHLLGQVYGVLASADRLRELMDLPEDPDRGSLPDFEHIRLSHVSFRYDGGETDVLHDFSRDIHRGDCIAVIGASGRGKTTLFQLLLGIYRPTAGEVRFENSTASVPASRGTRGLFAYVPQGNSLLSGTLRENLTLFADNVSDEEIRQAVRSACLEELTEAIGLDAVLGERGIGLSEGQAQRVAIARALLSGAPVLLLDEATSALDEETEAKLLANLAALRDREKKTVLIVTHRPAALQICTQRWEM